MNSIVFGFKCDGIFQIQLITFTYKFLVIARTLQSGTANGTLKTFKNI